MEKIDKLLKRYLKRKVKMTTAVLVAFLISGSLSFASGGASGIGDVLDDQLHDLYLEPGEYTPDEDGNVNMTLINRQDGNKEDMPDTEKYNMDKEEYDKLSDHDKELLQKRRIKIKGLITKPQFKKAIKSDTLTVTDGNNRLLGDTDVKVELKEKSIGKEHLTEELYNELKNAAGGSTNSANITSTTLNVTDSADGSGKNIELKDNTVDTNHLKDNAVTESKITNGAVTAGKLATDSVTTEKIVNKNVTTEKLADKAVTETQLGDSAVTTIKIQDGAVTAGKLGASSVTSEKLSTDSVTTEKIVNGNVTKEKLAENSVSTGKIENGAVTTDKLGVNSVTGEKIQDGVISKDKLDTDLKAEIDGKVNKTEMTGDVTSTTLTIKNGENRLYGPEELTVELKNDTVDTNHLKDNAVTGGKIQAGAVSKDKLSDNLKTEINNKANADATNISIPHYVKALSMGANLENPAGMLVKDSDLKKHLDLNYYTKPEVDRISSKSDAALSGVANAVAMANLPQVSSYNDYRHMVSAAYGNYEGQSAISVGLSGISQNNRVTYKVSGSLNTKGKLALGAGIGVMIGKVKTPTIEMPTSIKDKLEKSEKERQEMQVKLSEQKEMVNKQAEQIKDLYEIIKGLKEELKKR